MTWKQRTKGKRTGSGVLVCARCEAESKVYRITSPAAPELSICEQAGEDGWGYDLGFQAMLMGHTTVCPACLAKGAAQ